MEITLDRYYNRYGQEIAFKDYKEILFRAGDSLQSAELNELQSSIKGDFSKLADQFFANGAVVSGIDITIEKVENGGLYDLTISHTAGTIYGDGEFIAIEASTLTTVEGVDIEDGSSFNIGAIVLYEEITENEDITLLDPATGSKNFNLPGAGRLKITARMALESEVQAGDVYFPLFSIKNGEVEIPGITPDPNLFDYVKDYAYEVVAKYDRNSNGNYLVSGHSTSFVGNTNPFNGTPGSNLGPFWFNISSGNSNVNGYNFDVDFSRYLEISNLVDFEEKRDEPTTFNGEGYYDTRHSPIHEVTRISGPKIVTDLKMDHGDHAGATDEFPAIYQPVLSIQSIKQGSTTYIQGTDYQLIPNTDEIDWIDGGNEPAPNSEMTITFVYKYTETAGGFTAGTSATMGDISPDYKKIYLHGFAVGSSVEIDYDFTLQRNDVILIDTLGNLTYMKGVPAESNPRIPKYDESIYLSIASVLLRGDDDPLVTYSTNRTFKMSDIQLILDSVNDNAYNIGRIALEQNFTMNQPGAKLRNVFVENFDNDDFRDQGYDNDALTTGGNLELNIEWGTESRDRIPEIDDMGLNFLGLDIIPDADPFLVQPHYTKSRKINSYLHALPPVAKLTVYPKVYSWVDRTTFNSWARMIGRTEWIDPNRPAWEQWWWRNRSRWNADWWSRHKAVLRVEDRVVSTTNTTTTRTIQSPRIIPQIPLRIKSNVGAYNSNEEVVIKMDNISCGTLTANSSGTIDSVFNIPEGMLSGDKEITAEGTDSGAKGSTSFKAIPIEKILTRIRNFIRISWLRMVHDPVAQTFTVENDSVLDKLEVIFEVKSQTPVACIVCETTNGYPDKSKTLAVSEVQVIDLVDAGEKQQFVFDDKVTLISGIEYAFIIVNDDAIAELQVAELGKRTLDAPQKWLTDPAYMTGVLFSSANNSAWTAHQKEDIRFWIHGCTFNQTKTYKFTGYSAANITDVILMSNAVINKGTSVKYKLILVDRAPTAVIPNEFEIEPFDQLPLLSRYTGDIEIEATLTSEDGKFTPELELQLDLGIGTLDTSSAYTSVGIEVDSTDEKLTAMADLYEPSGTAVNFKAQVISPVDQTISWVPLTRKTTTPIGHGWVEIEFELDLQPGGTPLLDIDQDLTRLRIELSTTDDYKRPQVSNLRFSTAKI